MLKVNYVRTRLYIRFSYVYHMKTAYFVDADQRRKDPAGYRLWLFQRGKNVMDLVFRRVNRLPLQDVFHCCNNAAASITATRYKHAVSVVYKYIDYICTAVGHPDQ